MGRRRRLLWLIYPSYVAIVFVSLLAVGGFAASALRHAYLGEAEDDLLVRARLFSEMVRPLLGSPAELERRCQQLGRLTSTRLTVIAPDGAVLGDSEHEPGSMENHRDRREIVAALANGHGRDVRRSKTLNRDLLYVAVTLEKEGRTEAVVRASRPVASLAQTLAANYEKIGLAVLAMSALAALASWLVSRRLGRTLGDFRQGAARLAAGDLSFRLRPPDSEEFGALAETINDMAADLAERIQTVTDQRNELQVMLTAMVEAVMVVDRDERIVRVNRAAGELLGLHPDEAAGRALEEVARSVPLLQFVARTLSGDGPTEGEMSLLKDGGEISLSAHGNVIRNARGMKTHALVALHDVTRLKKLEAVRRDFVANVSHELKTPLTSIKGAVETLKTGAEGEDAARFIDIIARHADRLNAIIDDLLALSRIEQGEEKYEIALEDGPLAPVVAAAVATVERAAGEKGIAVQTDCPADLTALINPALLEQALVNLLDNAIKYSEPGSPVRVTTGREGGRVKIAVADRGPGIPPEHLDRIFERFYRVDRARSRKLGGTGLGLSIVKHIVEAHGGQVRVESEVGRGSEFTITLG